MRAINPSANGVFVDYLSLTCSPGDSFVDDLTAFFADYGFLPVADGLLRLSHGGTVHLKHDRRGFDYFSASGQVLDYLRMQDAIHGLVGCLVGVPHNVTRLDLATDVAGLDTPRELRRVYRAALRGAVSLGRKAVKPSNVNRLMGRRWDGKESGTVYLNPGAGGRTGARVYDKAKQMLEMFGISYLQPELLRVEVIARKSYATLHDVINPDALFFHLASPDLLPKPDHVPAWVRAELNPMALQRLNTKTDWQRVTDTIEASSDLRRLSVLLSGGSPAMLDLALSRIRAKLLSSQNPGAMLPTKTGTLDR